MVSPANAIEGDGGICIMWEKLLVARGFILVMMMMMWLLLLLLIELVEWDVLLMNVIIIMILCKSW